MSIAAGYQVPSTQKSTPRSCTSRMGLLPTVFAGAFALTGVVAGVIGFVLSFWLCLRTWGGDGRPKQPASCDERLDHTAVALRQSACGCRMGDSGGVHRWTDRGAQPQRAAALHAGHRS